MKCQECITQKKGDNCQACYEAEKRKYRTIKKLLDRTIENHKTALQKQKTAHQTTQRQNLELITNIKKGLRDIMESKKLFNTRHLLFTFLEDMEE